MVVVVMWVVKKKPTQCQKEYFFGYSFRHMYRNICHGTTFAECTYSFLRKRSLRNCIGTNLLGQALNFYWFYSPSKTDKRLKLLNVFRHYHFVNTYFFAKQHIFTVLKVVFLS